MSAEGTKRHLSIPLVLAIMGMFFVSHAQEVGEFHHDVTTKEWNFELMVNTSGFGIGFQHGRTPDIHNKHFWELEFLYNQHPKSIRSVNIAYNWTRPCRYGQLYTLFFLQGGYGYQRTLHQKPYWGGVAVNMKLSAGPTLGLGIPCYVEVLNYNTGFSEIVRYNPEKHNLNNILGGGGLFTGIMQTIFRPGFYAKIGFNFEFAKSDYRLHALEVGATYNMIFPFVQQMAQNKAKAFYLTGYIAYNFGHKKGIYKN